MVTATCLRCRSNTAAHKPGCSLANAPGAGIVALPPLMAWKQVEIVAPPETRANDMGRTLLHSTRVARPRRPRRPRVEPSKE